jgi:hypothetical protein
MDRVAGVAAEIQSGVHGRDMQERVHAYAEHGAQIDVAVHRFAHWHPQ